MEPSQTSTTRIFITGASSDIMQAFLSHLEEGAFEIFALTRNPNQPFPANVKPVVGDLHNISQHETLITFCDVIMHAAAITHSLREELYFQVNYEATKTLVDLSQKNNSRFIFISTRAVGKASGAYGYSKQLAEDYIKNNCRHWLIFRPAEVMGVRKNEGIESLIQNARSKKIIPYPTGLKSKLFPIHATDVASIMFSHIFMKNTEQKIITINGQEEYTYLEIIKLVADEFDHHPILIPVPKAIMQLLVFLIKIFRLNTSIVPDQVARLYSQKEASLSDKNLISLRQYVKSLKE